MSVGRGTAPDASAGPSVRLAASPSTAAEARSFVVTALRGWQVGSESVDDAEVVVSELVTNALLHGRATEVGVTLADRGAVVRLQVAHLETTSRPPAALAPLTVAADETHGRGLAIVDVLSSAWGVEESGSERRVWAELVSARGALPSSAERDAALAELAAALDRPTDPAGVGRAVTGWAFARLTASFVGIALPDHDDPALLHYLSVEPLPPASAGAWSRFRIDADAPAAAAFRYGGPFFHETRSAAVAGFPDLGPALAAAEMTALAHLPLLDRGRPIGTLALAWSHGRELDVGDRRWLAGVAEAAAVALTRVGVGPRDDALSEP